MKSNTRKLIFVILLNVFLAGLALYVLDSVGVITFGQVFEKMGLKKDSPPRIEDPFLLMREEIRKRERVLLLKESELGTKVANMKKQAQLLKDRDEHLKNLERQMKEREKKVQTASLAKVTRTKRIREVATQLMNMPPEKAVARLQGQSDDLLIIEILRMIDQIAAEGGGKSMVPYYLSLMDKKRAATIQRKMANISPAKKVDF